MKKFLTMSKKVDNESYEGSNVLDRGLFIRGDDGEYICIGNIELVIRYLGDMPVIHHNIFLSSVSPAIKLQDESGRRIKRIKREVDGCMSPVPIDLTGGDTDVDDEIDYAATRVCLFKNSDEHALDDDAVICDKHYKKQWKSKVKK